MISFYPASHADSNFFWPSMKTPQTCETMQLLAGLTPAMIACIAGDKELEQLLSAKGGTKASSLHKKPPGSKVRQHGFFLFFDVF